MKGKGKGTKKNSPGQGRKPIHQTAEEKTKAKHKSNRKYYEKWKQVTLRLDLSDYAAIVILARKEGCTVNKFLIEIIKSEAKK